MSRAQVLNSIKEVRDLLDIENDHENDLIGGGGGAKPRAKAYRSRSRPVPLPGCCVEDHRRGGYIGGNVGGYIGGGLESYPAQFGGCDIYGGKKQKEVIGIREAAKMDNKLLNDEAKQMGITGRQKTLYKIKRVKELYKSGNMSQEQANYMLTKYEVGMQNIGYALENKPVRRSRAHA